MTRKDENSADWLDFYGLSPNNLQFGVKTVTRLPQNPAIDALIARYRKEAHARGLTWDLTRNECLLLFTTSCCYCDAPPLRFFRVSGGTLYYSGIDRVNNLKGYISNNCVSCCYQCNRSKHSLSLPAFEEWVERISRCLRERNWAGIGSEMEWGGENLD